MRGGGVVVVEVVVEVVMVVVVVVGLVGVVDRGRLGDNVGGGGGGMWAVGERKYDSAGEYDEGS